MADNRNFRNLHQVNHVVDSVLAQVVALLNVVHVVHGECLRLERRVEAENREACFNRALIAQSLAKLLNSVYITS